ncbi:MFS transporter [Alteromonas sp. KUL49]|uniref:MFS transporter n=1 Tax=Alteromonas sp. KUL49 TaxID=2480798 RepID=UPI00102EE6DD|nr:MFS transporter [Alteromonas sp. KUL49]TAP38706.1 MFS transporter [Alteromonas sp. KUL49]GEA12658.1 MFS transporter [Alteromonas sp. KUL49]
MNIQSNSQNAVLSVKEKVAYALGDTASNLYWRLFDVFLFIFYTDVFGIPAATVGTMMLAARLVDAFSDPFMGALADRTNTRWGKFRPYLLWGGIPLLAAGVLTFTVPDLGDSGKVIWAYLTYIAMMLAYTFINVPYGAMMGIMTGDTQQRTTLSSFRFIGAFSGGTIVAYFTPSLVEWLGNGDVERGWQLTLVVYGTIALIMYTLCFAACKERVHAIAPQSHSPFRDIKDLLSNKPWLVLFVLALVIMLTISIRASSGTFYLKYFLEREDLISNYMTLYMISLAVGAASTPLLTRFFDKRVLLIGLMVVVAVLACAQYFVGKEQVTLHFAIQGLIGLCLGPKSPLVFSMYADTADYSEWRTNRRSTAMVFSAAAFSQKLGGALAGYIIGMVLGSMGYMPNMTQSPESQHGIILLMTVIPGVFALAAAACIHFYPLSSAQLEKVQSDLAKRKLEGQYDT